MTDQRQDNCDARKADGPLPRPQGATADGGPAVWVGLLGTEDELGPAFEHAPILILVTTARGDIRRANRAARTIAGGLDYRPGATLRNALGCPHSGPAQRDEGALCAGCIVQGLVGRSSQEQRRIGPVEVSLPTMGRGPRIFRATTAPLTSDGSLVLTYLQDATQERAAERAARVSEARYVSLVNSTRDAVGLLDGDLRWIALNPPMRELVRRLREHEMGLDLARFAPPVQSNGTVSADVVRERVAAAREGVPQRFELECLAADGETSLLDVAITEVDSGLIQVTAREITEIREAQGCIEAERDLLFAMNRADDLESAARVALDGIVQITGMAGGCICVHDPSTGEARPTHATGLACERGVMICESVAASPSAEAGGAPLRTWVAFPLRHEGRLLGSITVLSDTRAGIARYRLLAAETATSALAAVVARCHAAQNVSTAAAGLRAVVESTDCAILMLDRELRLQLYNAAWAQHMRVGYGIEARVGMELLSALPDRMRSWWRELYLRALRGERIRETFVDAVGDQQRVYGMVIHPIIEAGHVIGVSQFGRDLTRIRQTNERLAELSRSVVLGHEEERRRLSRELHDEIGQVLTAVKISLERLHKSGVADPVGRRLAAAARYVYQAISDVRRLCLELRPPLLNEAGLVPALEALAERLGSDDDRSIVFDTSALAQRLPIEVESTAFRVVQEALTNALRHSGASGISVVVRPDGDHLLVSVRDDGCGFDPSRLAEGGIAGVGLGLAGMRERVELLSGQFELVSHAGEGTDVRAWLPLATADGGPRA